MVFLYLCNLTVCIIQKMNEDQPSVQNLPELRYEEVTHHIRNERELPAIREDRNLPEIREDGAQTPTPTKPQIDLAQDENPERMAAQIENQEQAPEAKSQEQMSKFMKYAIIFGSIVGVLLIVGIIATVIIISNKSKTTIILVADYSKFGLVNSDSSLKTSKLIVKDPSTFGTEGQLPVYATSVAKPSGSTRTGGVTRSLQETSAQSSMTIVDESTSTTVTTFSNGLDMKVGIDFSSVLETVLANQAQLVQETEVSEASTSPATTNLMSSGDQKTVEQPENKQFVFYEVVDKLTAILKKEIAKMDPKSKVDQAVCHDMKYNKEKSALEFTPTSNAEPPQTVPFFDPSMIPQIKDFTNETEVAEAAASIVLKIIAKSKEFFSKNIQKLQQVAEVSLSESQPNVGSTSIYRDQPEDIQKLCPSVSDSVIRCENRVFDSKAINIAPKSPQLQYESKPTIVVIMDA